MIYSVEIIQLDGFYPRLRYKSKNKNIKNNTFVIVELYDKKVMGRIFTKNEKILQTNEKEILEIINLN